MKIIDNKYEVMAQIGAGGMGTVYKCRHQLMDRVVAIKILRPQKSDSRDDRFLKRFQREARATCRVEHPNAVTIYDFGVDNHSPYLVMEYLEGQTLAEAIAKNQPLPFDRVYTCFNQICSAVGKAHGMGIIHRDLKPANVMIGAFDAGTVVAKVMDFGICKLTEEEDDHKENLTEHGTYVGSPRYMAPEMFSFGAVDGRADIYALGIMLYEALCGKTPFDGKNVVEILMQHTRDRPPPFHQKNPERQIPEAISTVVFKALAKKPNDRYESVIDFIGALRDAVHGTEKTRLIRDRVAETTADATTYRRSRTYATEELLDICGRAKQLFNVGNFLKAFELLDDAIQAGSADPKMIHRAVLSLANVEAISEAERYFSAYKNLLPKSEEYRTLEARLLKDRFKLCADPAEKKRLGRAARDRYCAVYEESRGFFSGINAATLSLLIGDVETAHKLAKEVLQICSLDGSEGYWLYATQAEASLILGQVDKVKSNLSIALKYAATDFANRSSTYKQLQLICEVVQAGSDAVDVIRPPTVIHYTGHMIHGMGSAPGMDADDEPRLREEIRTALNANSVGFAYGSAACGADLLVAEEILRRGAELHVILPFAHEKFRTISVAPAGQVWERRFNDVIENATSVTTIAQDTINDAELLFTMCSREAMGRAVLGARRLGSRLTQLALWNERETGGAAGTAADVAHWRQLGLRSTVIPVPKPRKAVDGPGEMTVIQNVAAKRQFHAVIFADVQGFSTLSERMLPEYMAQLNALLVSIDKEFAKAIVFMNTWGDAVFIVVNCIKTAAEIAVRLATPARGKEKQGATTPDSFGFRVSVHAGPVFMFDDAVLNRSNYYGATVNLAARIEPRTPMHSVFATESFAAHLAAAPDHPYWCEYAGEHELPKGFGKFRMYYLRRKQVSEKGAQKSQ